MSSSRATDKLSDNEIAFVFADILEISYPEWEDFNRLLFFLLIIEARPEVFEEQLRARHAW